MRTLSELHVSPHSSVRNAPWGTLHTGVSSSPGEGQVGQHESKGAASTLPLSWYHPVVVPSQMHPSLWLHLPSRVVNSISTWPTSYCYCLPHANGEPIALRGCVWVGAEVSPGQGDTAAGHLPTAWTVCPSSCMTPRCGARRMWSRSSRNWPAGQPPCSTGPSCSGSMLASGS